MSEENLRMVVTRYRPGEDREPVTQSFSIPYHDDWVVLDALQYIKDNIDGTLSFRWSCHMGVCGSCGMMVNGRPELTCAAFLRDSYPNPVKDRKSTRLNSSHRCISYAVFCLKK